MIKQIGLALMCVGTLCTTPFAEATPAISRPEGNTGVQLNDSGVSSYSQSGSKSQHLIQYETPRFQYQPIAKQPTQNKPAPSSNPFLARKSSRGLTFGQMADSIKKTNSSDQSFTLKYLAEKLKEKKATPSTDLNTEKRTIRSEADHQ
jgi:hypothetical protein